MDQDHGKLYQPHDRLIKYTFGREESATELLRGYLPKSKKAGRQFDKLEVVPGSFVEPGFGDSHTDILYKLTYKRESCYLYCLFEHQSTPDRWMGLRIFAYKSAIWRHLLRQKPKTTKLPAIYVLVVYSGKKPWTAPLQWKENLAFPPDAAPEIWESEVDFSYQLINLSHLSAEEIRGDVAGRLTLGLMKAALEDRVLEWLKNAIPMLQLLRKKEVSGMFEVLLRYLLAVDTSVSRDQIVEVLEHHAPAELTQKAMSIADQLIAEGEKSGFERGEKSGFEKGEKCGLEKGEKRGLEKGEKRGLEKGRIRLLQEFLHLPQSTDAELEAKSTAELQQLAGELRARLAKA